MGKKAEDELTQQLDTFSGVGGRIGLPLLGDGSGEFVRVRVGRKWWSVRGAGGSNRVDEGGKSRQPRG